MTKHDYLYTVLAEEAAEVAQAAAKVLRFGEKAYCPDDQEMKDNASALLEEYYHLTAAVKTLQDEQYLPTLDENEQTAIIINKQRKVEHYFDEHQSKMGSYYF